MRKDNSHIMKVVSEIFLVSSMSLEGIAEVFCPWYFPEVCDVMYFSFFFADLAGQHSWFPND